MKVKCGICSQDHERSECKIFQLTEAEKASMADPQDEYVYCRPCYGIMSNPITATAFMKGQAQIKLTQLGVPNAEELATKYHADLLARAKVRS